MSQHSQQRAWNAWPGWSTISASSNPSFTLWFTGLPGTGKTTLALLAKKTLLTRGYKVEIIDSQTLSHWLQQELHIDETVQEDYSHTPGYDAFITYICSVMARNGIITITTSVSPHTEARLYAREQLHQFVEVYLHCPEEQRYQRLRQQEHLPTMHEHVYQPPMEAELTVDTGHETPERSTLRIIDYLEQYGFIAPLWEISDTDEEIDAITARLRALGYLE